MAQVLTSSEILTYTIVDAARVSDEMETARKLQNNFLSLYMGQSEELLNTVAPYLFIFQNDTEFGKWHLEKGWGKSWGMFCTTQLTIEEMRKHFRKFLIVKTETGQQLYFRFYDPRVLRVFLPTCDEQQLVEFFGPVLQFICEDENPEFLLIFSLNGNKLITERVIATTIFTSLKKSDIAAPVLPKENNENVPKEITVELKAQRPARRFFD